MSMSAMPRTLDELEVRALPGLRKLEGELQKKIIGIAARESPTKTKDLTRNILQNCGFAPQEAEEIAKSVRWLAVAKRDKEAEHGFETIVSHI